jgi:homoserine O-acetyltransferase/O-succinyltransferase
MSPEHTPSPGTCIMRLPGPVRLDLGAWLPDVTVAYRTWGSLNEEGTNAVLVCHALTGSADVDRWWPHLLGAGHALDPDADFVICSNVLGSCYGTTGPPSDAPAGHGSWGPEFPRITVRDMVRVQAALLERLGVQRLRLVVGGSLGGMQALEWGAMYPERVDAIAPIAVSGRHSSWCIALSEAQRQAVTGDPCWRGGRYPSDAPPRKGLSIARMIAMCSYRSRESFDLRFERRARPDGPFEVEQYLRHHGEKLAARFDANAYLTLTRAMDTHDVARGRGPYADVLRSVRVPALVVAVDSDVLYPPVEQQELARLLPGARLAWLTSPHGHDAFLIEGEAMNRLLVDFRARVRRPKTTPRRRLRSCATRVDPAVGRRKSGKRAPLL